MLNGIGGKTIAEAKENILYEEFWGWVKYRNKYGTLNPSSRMEEMLAIVISMNSAIHCKEIQPPNKFMPYLAPESCIFRTEPEGSNQNTQNPPIEAVFGLLKAVANKR